jgi:hypothetical protein
MNLRVGQHMYHALLVALSGQSAVATWPLMGAMAVAIQAVGAFLLGIFATRGRVAWALAISLLAAAHPLMHSACQTTFISMAMGMAFLTTACVLAFTVAEEGARRMLAAPLGVCALALFLCYQEILPTFVMVAGLFWAASLWASRTDRAQMVSLGEVAVLAACVAVALSPMGVWWSVNGLLRQMAGDAHGAPPELEPEMLLSLVTGLAQLPGTWEQLDRGTLAAALRWGAIAVLAGGLVLQLARARCSVLGARAVVAILGSTVLLFVLVLRRSGDPELLHYGLSRVVLYHANLFFVLGLSGWALLEGKHRRVWTAAALGGYGLVVFGFSLGSFKKLFAAPHFQAIPAVTQVRAWLNDVPQGGILLFETKSKERVAREAPYWHWLGGRSAFDTFLEPVPTMCGHSSALFGRPVGYYAIPMSDRNLPEGMREIATDGAWRIFQAGRPFATRINSFWDAPKRMSARATEKNLKEGEVGRDWWLCSPLEKIPSATLEISSRREEDVELLGCNGTQTVRVKPGSPARVTLPLNPESFTTPFQIRSITPVMVRVVDEPKESRE